MPDFETSFAAAAEDILTAIGQAATFTPAAGSPVSLMVSVEHDVALLPAGGNAQTWELGTTVECLLADLAAAPRRGETFTVGAAVYTVQRVLENDGYFAKVAVS